VVLGYDRARHVFLGLDDQSVTWHERAVLAADRPEDSFVWWLVARRTGAEPDRPELRRVIGEQAHTFRTRRMQRLSSAFPVQREEAHVPYACSPQAQAGLLLSSPPSPVDAGEWQASFVLRLEDIAAPSTVAVARIEVTSGSTPVEHAHREILACDLERTGKWTTVDVSFKLAQMTMGVQLSASALGSRQIGAQMTVDLHRPEDRAGPENDAAAGASVPEPRTLEIIRMLGRRSATKAKAAVTRG
jgi:hypothetical protein